MQPPDQFEKLVESRYNKEIIFLAHPVFLFEGSYGKLHKNDGNLPELHIQTLTCLTHWDLSIKVMQVLFLPPDIKALPCATFGL